MEASFVPAPDVKQFMTWVSDLMYEEGLCYDCAEIAENLDGSTNEVAICEHHKDMRHMLAFQ